jgi:hypothetical protein
MFIDELAKTYLGSHAHISHLQESYIVVCQEPVSRRLASGIDILPWKIFLERLWAGEIMG